MVAQDAFRSGRKAEAKALSNKGKAEAALMEKANRMASDAAFQGNNMGRDSATIDLHGLYVDEAVRRARECIVKARGEVSGRSVPRPSHPHTLFCCICQQCSDFTKTLHSNTI